MDINTAEAVARARQNAARQTARGNSAEFCADCDEPIPQARRQAVPGVKLCVSCQSGQDRSHRQFGGINRRASKDALLK
ncbi:TraR/DksA C4-type zinc finger protein [Paracoccus sp. JM45]|uniref:TraR/DksA C4-type zinc finger protein n=1 Tax=Paracoccus sp. JM45 TaxID=2283626 RepID=UPI002107FACB|nr:TraR/DksA C4-type zinc finger protein [Paracoccus sp. JM45]